MKYLDEYISVGQKRMRCGYTTGTCAAAAARAAAELLLHGEELAAVIVQTPAGIDVTVEVEELEQGLAWAQCAVRKDAGDDPDVTDGVLVFARVELVSQPGIHIDGGVGVGRVTREGLDQPVGAAAINSVPRRMILEQVEGVFEDVQRRGVGGLSCSGSPSLPRPLRSSAAHPGSSFEPSSGEAAEAAEGDAVQIERAISECGLLVTISIPAGVELAARTFNPRLGIEGGISVIGTSGIVKPMSEEALVSSIELEMKTLRARGVEDLLIVPGNYGRDFACGQLSLDMDEAVSCSNYFGATLDGACMLGFKRVLIVGHIGKMAKVAGGVMNTHSRVADCRVEVIAAHAALVGAPRATICAIMKAATTDAALEALYACDLAEPTAESLVASLADKLNHRVNGVLQVEAIVFSNVYGVVGKTGGADALMQIWGRSSR